MKISELLNDESKWTKNARAKDSSGKWVNPTDSSAVSWCLIGAFSKCYPAQLAPRDTIIFDLHKAMKEEPNYSGSIADFNDHPNTTFSDIRRVIEKAGV